MSLPPNVEGFAPPTMIGEGTELPVYESLSEGKPLIVLHELPGMTPTFIEYCQRMSAEGFKVYMPLMFKSPGSSMTPFQMLSFCMTREFKRLFAADDITKARPFTAWLMQLVDAVGVKHQNEKIGVIGMCLTGGFAISAIAKPPVRAVAACQPSIPAWINVKTLGLSDTERKNVTEGVEGKDLPCVKGYRFEKDWMSRDAHMKAAKTLLGDGFERYPDLPGRGHSTLTTDTRSEKVYQDVLSFLTQRL